MAKITSIPRKRRMPTYTGRLMIDTCRGVLRARKWPRKYGKPRSVLQQFWVDWFIQANLLAKYADPMSQIRAKELTAHTGMYPRDILLAAMRGRLYTWVDQNGWKWFPMAAIQDISDSLDVLAQTVGDVLVRATDRWRAPPTGVVNDVLTNQGPDNPPIWKTPTPGSGLVQEVLAGTPIIPDGTKNTYDVPVSPYSQITLNVDDIGFAASDQLIFRFSTDNGVTFKAGASDYWWSRVTYVAHDSGFSSWMAMAPDAGTADHNGIITFGNLRAGRATMGADASRSTTRTARRAGYATFAGPITDIQILSFSGANMNAGALHLVGLR